MRKSVLAVCCLLVLVAATPVMAGGDHAFFDMENCAMCKSLIEDPNLLMGLGWDNHTTADGMITITTYKSSEAEASFAKAHKSMQATGAKLAAGEEMQLCGFCNSTMGLMQKGATREEIEFEGGVVTLVTSKDPKTVEAIHAHCDKINEEMKKMQAEMQG